MKLLFVLTLILVAFASIALVHNRIVNVIGTVSTVSTNEITVGTVDGKWSAVVINRNTKYWTIISTTIITVDIVNGMRPAVAHSRDTRHSTMKIALGARDIKVGDCIAIHAVKKGDDLVAVEVRVGLVNMEKAGMVARNKVQGAVSNNLGS